MDKIAFLFAGQGAQYPGMGRSLCNASPAAADVFITAEKLRPGLSGLCFSGTAEELALTANTQPCVFTTGLAAAQALRGAGVEPQAVAGFSLGELAALTFAGMLTGAQCFSLVCQRAALMQDAAEKNPGGMVAVLRLPDETVEDLCKTHDALWPVNYNSDAQLVVAGDATQLSAFCAQVKQAGGIAKPLNVSGAFHSPMMASAADAFGEIAQTLPFAAPRIPVYANLTAKPYAHPYAPTLTAQIQSPVLWKQTLRRMAQDGYTTFIEVGAGKTLTGLVKRVLPQARALHVQDAESLTATLEALNT